MPPAEKDSARHAFNHHESASISIEACSLLTNVFMVTSNTSSCGVAGADLYLHVRQPYTTWDFPRTSNH